MTNQADAGAAVSLRGLRKTFGHVHAADGVDLMIAPGEVVALLGPNGAGKTTTMELLLGLTTPDQGEISVFGASPAKATAQGLVGAMLQSGGFMGDMTGREIVKVMAAQYPKPLRVDEALDKAGIREAAKLKYAGLSGGQKQRVRFAAALVCDPDLLVLDEPTVAMDVQGRHDFWTAMRAFTSGGKTVVFATHYLAEAQDFADRVVLMRRGQIIADGSVAEITAKVDGRTITATIAQADSVLLRGLPGVNLVEQRGDLVTLHALDSDLALRAMLDDFPQARDIAVTAMSLEDAFVALTADEPVKEGA